MTTAILISFRETLEASLLIGVVLAILGRDGDRRSLRWAWAGIIVGIILSILGGVLLDAISVVLTERMEEIYEGVLMLTASGILAWIVAWLGSHGRNARSKVESDVLEHLTQERMIGIFLLCFFATAREGMEMAVFLRATNVALDHGVASPVGILIGITAALIIAIAVLYGLRGIPLRQFFIVTTALLLSIGFGLAVQGIGEFQEARVFTIFPSILWDTSAFLQKDSLLGHIASTFTGYEERPTVLQGLVGSGYIALVLLLLTHARKRARTRGSM